MIACVLSNISKNNSGLKGIIIKVWRVEFPRDDAVHWK